MSWHPSASELLLHLEGELDGRAARRVANHLAICWDCRVLQQEMERGITNFVDYRKQVLLPAIAPASPNLYALKQRFEPWLAAHCCQRPMSIAGFISALLIVVILATYVVRPPALTATEVFRNATKSSARPLPASVVKAQRIQIRRGARVLERELLHGAGRGVDTVNAQWTDILRDIPVDPNDPLNPIRFQRWHARQERPHDEIVESNGLVTLTSEVPVLRAAITVRRSDWHTVAERFELPGEPPVEIHELAFELRKIPDALTARVELPPAPKVAVAATRHEAPTFDAELAEVRVRERLAEAGADRIEVPTITSEPNHLIVEAVVDSADRRAVLEGLVMDIPGVSTRFLLPSDALASDAPRKSAPAAFPTNPPLAQKLWVHLGSLEAANNYLDMVRDSWLRALGPSSAMARLADRYPAATEQRLSGQVRSHLNELASRYRNEILTETRVYLQQASEPLDVTIRANGLKPAMPVNPPAQCSAWQQSTQAVLGDLKAMQTAMRRLFQVDYAETPIDLSAETLLIDASASRARLYEHLRCLEQPR